MGSFSSTCAVSNLPIEAGDPVRFFLVTENPYDEGVHYIHDQWVPRSWALRGKYNDYGSVEDFETGPAQQVWLDALQYDLIERGAGDNLVHDDATLKGMTFDMLLDALRSRRILVKRRVDAWFMDPKMAEKMKQFDVLDSIVRKKKTVLKGVPTRRRVEKLLEKNRIQIMGKVYKRKSKFPQLVVNRQAYGRIKIRANAYGDSSLILKRAEQILAAEYATMLTREVGEGSSFGDELLVRPKAGLHEYRLYKSRKNEKTSLKVRLVMIREDVWDALCKLPYQGDIYGEKYTLEKYRELAQGAWDDLTKVRNGDDWVERTGQRYSAGGAFTGDVIPFSVGLGSSFTLMARKAVAGEVTPEQANAFLDSAAQFKYLEYNLAMSRYLWRPTYSNGPQFGEWGIHSSVLRAILGVSDAKAAEMRAELAEAEKEDLEEWAAEEEDLEAEEEEELDRLADEEQEELDALREDTPEEV